MLFRSQHRRWLHDQEHLSEAITIQHLGQHTENSSVRVIKGPPQHLPLQHQQLVTQNKNLRIAPVPAGQQQTNTSQHHANNQRHRPKHHRDPNGNQPPDQHRRIFGTLKRAIEDYADRRRERAAALQAASREAGRNLQLTDAADVATRNARMLETAEAPIEMYNWVWGYDVTSAVADSSTTG